MARKSRIMEITHLIYGLAMRNEHSKERGVTRRRLLLPENEKKIETMKKKIEMGKPDTAITSKRE